MSAVMSRETPKQAARRLANSAMLDGFEPAAFHEYTDAQGMPIYWRIRLRHKTRRKPDGKPEKWMRPMRLDGEEYKLGEPEFANGKPLYRLHVLAANPDAPVFVVEGENKVDALAGIGILATTSGSATSADRTDWQPCAGRPVTIWPDNDQSGQEYAEAVRRNLLGLGASVSIINAVALGLGEGEDAVDWLAAHPGATAADVDALPRVTAHLQQENAESLAADLAASPTSHSSTVAAPRRPIKALTLSVFAAVAFPEREQLLGPLLHSQDLMMLFAARGVGKTHAALSLAFAVATGGVFLKWKSARPRKVLYLDGELPGPVLRERLAMHCPDVDEAMADNFKVFTPDLLPDFEPLPDLASMEGQEQIEGAIEPDTALVILDNLSAWARSGKENEAESWTCISDWLLTLRRRGIAVLMVHHAGKNGEQRGTSKREDLLDTSIKLHRSADYDPKQGAQFIWSFSKARHLYGDDAADLEMTMTVQDGRASWDWQPAELSQSDKIVALAQDGLSKNEIAEELGVNRSTVWRNLKKAAADGKVTLPEGKKPRGMRAKPIPGAGMRELPNDDRD